MLPIDDSFRRCHDSASSRLMGNSDLHLQGSYSRMPSLQPVAESSKRPSAFGIYNGLLEIGACNPCNYSFCDSCERGDGRVAHPTSSGNCYNEQNVKEHVPADSYKSSRPHIFQSALRSQLDAHHATPFVVSSPPLYHLGGWESPEAHPEKQSPLDGIHWDAKMSLAGIDGDWMTRRPYLQVDTSCQWVYSPESDSMETDTDDDSLLSNSTLSFSPPYSDSSDPPLPAHIFDLEDERHAPSSENSPQRAPSIPLARPEANAIYPPLEEYPDHVQLHDIPPMDLSTHAQRNMYDHYDYETVPSEAGPSHERISPLDTNPGSLFSSMSPESSPSFSNPFGLLSVPTFHYSEEWPSCESSVPCSPSRRRSRDLPLPDSEPPSSRPSSGIKLLSLPGAITDDDLIPASLASSNFIPDLDALTPSTPAPSGLLLWGTNGPLSDADLPIRRSYSPEPVPELNDLDTDTLDELAERAGEDLDKEEVRRVYEMRSRKRSSSSCSGVPYSQEKWEREQARELGLLLKLKLHLGDDNQKDRRNDTKSVTFADTPDLTPSSTAPSSRRPSIDEPVDRTDISQSNESDSSPSRSSSIPTRSHTSPTPKTSPKNRISTIDQLVANMVFHRQQEPLRRHPVRTRTWTPASNTAFVPTSSPLSPKGSTRALDSGKGSFVSPKSPLRHVILPGEDDREDHDNLGFDDDDADFDFLPLNTFVFDESNWLDSATILGGTGEAEAIQGDCEGRVDGDVGEGEDRGKNDENMNDTTSTSVGNAEATLSQLLSTPATTMGKKNENEILESGMVHSAMLCASPQTLSVVLSNDTPKVDCKDELYQSHSENLCLSAI